MPSTVNSVLVLIASPSDAAEERATVRDELNDWSVTNGPRQGIVLLPWLYERHAVASLGGRPQALINSQALDRADVVIAFFDSRLGTNTGVDVSGTAEEIHQAVKLGKPVHVYFSNEPLPREVDPEQLTKLNEFKGALKDQGLFGDYTDPRDLAAQVSRALQADIEANDWGRQSTFGSRTGAQLSWRHDLEREQVSTDRAGKIKMRTSRSRLVVKNSSAIDAENFKFEVEPADGTDNYLLRCDTPSDPITLYAHSELQWSLLVQGPMNLQISAEWSEKGIPRTAVVTIPTR